MKLKTFNWQKIVGHQFVFRIFGATLRVGVQRLLLLLLYAFCLVYDPLMLSGAVFSEVVLTKEEEEKANALLSKIKDEVKKDLDARVKVIDEKGEKSYKEILDKRIKPFEEMPIDALKKYAQDFEEINKAIADLKTRKLVSQTKSIVKSPYLVRALKKAYPEGLKSLNAGNRSFTFKLDSKKVATSSFGTDVVRGFREAGVDFAKLPELFILDLIQTMNGGPGSNPLSWVERNVAAIGGAGAKLVNALNPTSVAEEAAKPQMGFEWVARQEVAQTIAAIVPTTKQAVFNYPQLESEIRFELTRRLGMILQQQIINGDGTANTLKGINYYAKTFAAPTGLALGVDRANQYDVLMVAATQAMQSGFLPNFALVSVITNAQMQLTKDPTTGNYILPPFSTPGGLQVYGMRVIPTLEMPTDQFIVGDSTKSLFNWVEGITIEIGMINDDFQKNIWRIRGELQGVHRIKAHEAFAFVKGDMSVAMGQLETA